MITVRENYPAHIPYTPSNNFFSYTYSNDFYFHKRKRKKASNPLGMYLSDISSRYEKLTEREILELLKAVREGTFPRNPLVIKKANFIEVTRKGERGIEIEAPRTYLVGLENLFTGAIYNSLIEKCVLSRRKFSVWLTSEGVSDFEVTDSVGGVVKNPALANKKNLYLRLRTSEAVEARKKIVYGSLPFVVKLAACFGLPYYLEDLVSEGNVGLLKAVDKFSPERQASFFTCAGYWVNQSIKAFLLKNVKSFRIYHQIYEKMNFIRNIEERLITEEGISPSDERLHEEIKKLKRQGITTQSCMKITVDNIKDLRILNSIGAISLSQIDDTNGNGEKPPLDRLIEKELALDLLERLDPRRIRILKRKYGLGDYDEESNIEIGGRESLTGERIRQVVKESLKEIEVVV